MDTYDLTDLIEPFIAETNDFLQLIETNLLGMEQASVTQRETAVKEIFRAAHSIKGSAAMMSFNNLSAAAHILEDCLAILRDRADLSNLASDALTALLQAVDYLRTLTNESTENYASLDPNQPSPLLAAIAQIKTNLEAHYGKQKPPVISPTNQSIASETLKAIFEYELPPLISQLEAALDRTSESDLSKILEFLNQVYYQISGVAAMLQLPELTQIVEPIKELINLPNLTLEAIKSSGWEIAKNLQTARTQILQGETIKIPVILEEIDELEEELAELAITNSPSPIANIQSPITNHQSSVPNSQRPTIRVELDRLTELVNLVGELVINRTNLELQESELRNEVRRIRRSIQDLNQFGGQLREEYDRLSTLDLKLPVNSSSPNPNSLSPQALRKDKIKHGLELLEMDRYTEFHSTASEVIETTENIALSANKLDNLVIKFDHSTDQLRRITEQLRSRVMQLRVVSFSRAVDHLPRALREMCLIHNKDVNLLLLGRDTKIDESLLDALREPLVHLVRNAFDHGIESPEIRQAAGKPASGQIEIEARHQGGQTIITVADDGRGINPEIIRHKVIEKGLATEEQAQDFSIMDLYEFLFYSGFTTANEVSNLSGRGVGLDVVRNNLRSVRGTVKIDSHPGKGTSFIIKMPLLLSITDALMVRTDHYTVAVPLDAIEEIMHIQGNQIHVAGTQPMLWWREEFIRLVRLQELLHYSIPAPDAPSPNPLVPDHIPVLVLASSEGILAVVVERLLGQKEIVVKSLPAPMSKPQGILGSTILGDGRVVTILDVDDLVCQSQETAAVSPVSNHRSVSPLNSRKSPQILVVDDSYTIRQLLALTLSRANYRIIQAKDGMEALEKLQSGIECNLVIADIEMPRMDGFELLRSLKSTQDFAHIPVAMLTSRSGAKHREMAMSLGAVQYFTKPYSEAKILEEIAKLLGAKQ
jgi:chemotaxis family two-component system sensor histidine kinase/response regulator PixL